MNEIEINGEIYVKKNIDKCQQYYIVRTNNAGIFAGNIEFRSGDEVTMINARRIWKWEGAASLSQLAMEGTSNPSLCKFPCELGRVILFGAIEIIEATDMAEKSIKAVPVWEV